MEVCMLSMDHTAHKTSRCVVTQIRLSVMVYTSLEQSNSCFYRKSYGLQIIEYFSPDSNYYFFFIFTRKKKSYLATASPLTKSCLCYVPQCNPQLM